jgi:sporulation protein YlmC with PRC-barrel domain
MKQLRAIIVISILLGILSLSIPLKFYGVMSGIFGSLDPAPFNFSVVRTFTIVFALPAITLILMGVALYYVVIRLEKMPELEVIRESGEFMGTVKKVMVDEGEVESFVLDEDKEVETEDVLAVDDTIIVKAPENEFDEKEVYSEVGEFIGVVTGFKTDELGEITSLDVVKGETKKSVAVGDVLSTENVVIIKA